MSRPLLLIGQAPGPRTDPRLPLYPLPATSTGGRLAELMGLSLRQYLRSTERVNLIREFPGRHKRGDRFPMKEARVAARRMLPDLQGREVVLVGRAVACAFDVGEVACHQWLGIPGVVTFACVPHPSGRNRWYNAPANRALASLFWDETRARLLHLIGSPGTGPGLEVTRREFVMKSVKIGDVDVRDAKDLESLSTETLLKFYNQETGSTTKRFPSRAVGLERVEKLVRQKLLQDSGEAPPPVRARARRAAGSRGLVAPSAATGPSTSAAALLAIGSGMSFRMKPRREQKEPREDTKRARALALLSRREGALFSEIAEQCEWNRKDAYEGIRLLNTFCGFGLWHEREGDDYRIRVVDQAEYDRHVGATSGRLRKRQQPEIH